jgi:glycosyltransferase involved in cell wall biosynthesis
MKVLVASTSTKFQLLESLWDELDVRCELTHYKFSGGSSASLEEVIGRADLASFDRILIDANIRKLGGGYKALNRIPNLVFLEHDACQNFIKGSKAFKKFDSVLASIEQIKVLVSSRYLEDDFKSKGFDAKYFPKAYDHNVVVNKCIERDVELGFIGRYKHQAYTERKRFLQRMEKEQGLVVVRTEPGTAYNHELNRIRFFLSCDMGFKEYMIKNFEAMAAGCVLCAYRQPEAEQQALGFVDMENIVLYSDEHELLHKLSVLRKNPTQADRIAANGQALVEARHQWGNRADELIQILSEPLKSVKIKTFFSRIFSVGRSV